ncbi:MAG: DUF3054 domain-containing protein [Anaerolineae bacterium]|nr:DUF3054 domain-containing protein [Anaerolineae bacterium]
MNKTNTLPRLILLAGDLIAILLFVFIGQQDHATTDVNNPILGLLRAAFPFLITWLIVAPLVGAYPAAENITLRRLLLRGLNGWLIAAPLGLLLRAFLFERGGIPAIFMLLTLVVAGAFILVWRLVFGFIWQRRSKT